MKCEWMRRVFARRTGAGPGSRGAAWGRYLGIAAALTAGLTGAAAGKDSPLRVDTMLYHAQKRNLVDPDPPGRELGWVRGEIDSAYLGNPRGWIYNNLRCYSGRDATPRCTSWAVFDTARVLLAADSFLGLRPTEAEPSFPALDRGLIRMLARDTARLKEIELRRWEESDRGWAFFEGLFYLVPGLGLAALAELGLSYAMHRGYNLGYTALPMAGIWLAYTGYLYATYDRSPSLTVIRIRF